VIAVLLGVVAATAVAHVVALVRWPWIAAAPPPGPAGRAAKIVVVSLVGLLLGLLAPPLPALAATGWWVHRRSGRQREARRRSAAVRRALPEAVDLLLLATSAGVALPIAQGLVAPHVAAPVGPALAVAHCTAARGRPRVDALVAELAPLGDHARALAQVLGDHLRYGAPLGPALERIGLELRLDRRRQAELEARRVPVRLLGPLVSCILPAFALLTVVPLLVASLESLPL
jgi:tight adherence protein C